MPQPKLPILQRLLTRRHLLGMGAAGLGVALLPASPACCPTPLPDGGKDGGKDGGDRNDGGDGGQCPPSNDPGACPPGSCVVDENTLVLALADHPELVPVLGAASTQYACSPACPGSSLDPGPETGRGWGVYCDGRYEDPICHQNAIIVLHTAPSTFAALSASCTHQCCTVGLSNDASVLFCPCHSSTYDFRGGVQPGSQAKQDLPQLPVCFDGCAVYVQLGPGGAPDGGDGG